MRKTAALGLLLWAFSSAAHSYIIEPGESLTLDYDFSSFFLGFR